MTQRDIDEAVDLLSWLTTAEIRPMRIQLSRTIRMAQRRAGVTGEGTPPQKVQWSSLEEAVVFVLWQTSDEFLSARI